MADTRFSDFALLGEARKWLRAEAAAGGAKCPCCTQFTKVYRRPLNSGMARSLIRMYRAAGTDWQHVPTTTSGGSREEGKLRYWRLVEEDRREREDGGRAGWWRVTNAGRAFVLGQFQVPKHAIIFDARCLRLDSTDGLITIREALGKKFNYAELMADIPDYDESLLVGDKSA